MITKEEVVKLASEIDIEPIPEGDDTFFMFYDDELERFAQACYQRGIEDAAKVCDESYPYSVGHTDMRASKNLAVSIRALGETK